MSTSRMIWSSMSQELINRSCDLRRLYDEGYNIEIQAGHLLVKDIPYVTESREVRRGTLVSPLELIGDITRNPISDHVVRFVGEFPCDKNGARLNQIINDPNTAEVLPGILASCSFSSKPPEGYKDYYHKMTTYASILSSHAYAIDPTVTPKTFLDQRGREKESVFLYPDTASSLAGITAISAKLSSQKIAIVGLGGTGSYVLDLVAKTQAQEIHLYDGDNFENNNAFRSPGAASNDELNIHPKKVDYHCSIYSRMRKNIVPHAYFIDDSNIDELKSVGFVFLCIDNVQTKRMIANRLRALNIPFIDCGMGVYSVESKLAGILRVTTCTSTSGDHALKLIMDSEDRDNIYSKNIQVAELNALSAALAVIKWKKLCEYYSDFRREYDVTYTIDGNTLINEEIV